MSAGKLESQRAGQLSRIPGAASVRAARLQAESKRESLGKEKLDIVGLFEEETRSAAADRSRPVG